MDNSFNKYFEEIIIGYEKLNHNYLGITRKDYPKWQGWKIINQYKELGTHVNEIDDEVLNIHVRNFYYIKYLSD